MAKMGSGRGSMASETTLHQKGMHVKMPNPSDASTRCKGGSVNDGTRKETAPTPKSLGPREA
jgi:hypothetical protein